MSRKLILVLCLLLFASMLQAQEAEPLKFTFEDIERTYLLHIPENLEDPAPLVIVLHSRYGNGQSIADYTGFDALADEEGFMVAYPDGLDGEWNFVRGIPGYPNTHDDVAFLIALVDHIAESQPVDLSRVYIAGFSNGGFMAQRVACENPERFAAFASVAASGFGGMLDVCLEDETETAPMLLINGTADDNVLWNGDGVTRDGRTVYVTYPVVETLAYWAAFNGCEPDVTSEDLPAGAAETSVRKLTITCPEDTATVLYAVVNGGHNWPRKTITERFEFEGAINQDIDATQEIWNFFTTHSRDLSPEQE